MSNDVELYVAILKDAKRDYRAAQARIQHAEQFLAKHIDGLGYDNEQLCAADYFQYPPRTVTYNGGYNWIADRSYMLLFSKSDSGWHFWIAPVEGAGPSKIILTKEAKRLLDAPAGLVLHCAERIEMDVVNFLEQITTLVSASYVSAPRGGNVPAKRVGVGNGSLPPGKEDLH